MKTKDEMSPLDSWISISSNEELKLSKELQDNWIEKARSFRKFRGDILASSFEIEIVVDEIIAEVFFPNFEEMPDKADKAKLYVYANVVRLKEAFTRNFLKTPTNTFGKKIGLFRDISNDIKALGDLVTDTFKGELKKIVNIRNMFAHYPITFEMRGDGKIELAGLIIFSGEVVELTTTLCNEYKTLISTSLTTLKEILKTLRANKDRIGDSSIVLTGGVLFLGHSALGDDSWEVKDASFPINLEDFNLYCPYPTKADITVVTPDDNSDENTR